MKKSAFKKMERIHRRMILKETNPGILPIERAIPQNGDTEAAKGRFGYTWSLRSSYTYHLVAHVTQAYLKRVGGDWMELEAEAHAEFEYDYHEQSIILTHGDAVFLYEGKLFQYKMDIESRTQTISSNHDVMGLVQVLKSEIKNNNPLRKKHIHLAPTQDGFWALIKPTPSTAFRNLVLDPKMVEDIHDNTIFHLKHLDGCNGVIFHGAPGTGKSLMCQAIINEAIREGFSTCFIAGYVNFTLLAELLEHFLTPCLVVFEDIDAFALDREDNDNSNLSSLLQFLSGMTERKEKWAVIATTNYLHRLDKAIKDRPVRFNRKYEFKLPTNEEINQLLDVYFPEEKLAAELKRLCHDKQFAGAHISEIRRTALTLAKKRSLPLPEVFPAAVTVVHTNFCPARKQVGFASNGNGLH